MRRSYVQAMIEKQTIAVIISPGWTSLGASRRLGALGVEHVKAVFEEPRKT